MLLNGQPTAITALTVNVRAELRATVQAMRRKHQLDQQVAIAVLKEALADTPQLVAELDAPAGMDELDQRMDAGMDHYLDEP